MTKQNGAGDGAENTETTEQEPKADAFGMSEPAEPQAKSEGGEDKGDKGGDKGGDKKFDPIPEDHPTIVGLKNQIEEIKKSYGGNLSSQRDIIKTLEGKIDALTSGKGGAGAGDKGGEEATDVLFKDIKWSKDLTKEEREEMTETEIKQMDAIASMQEAQNKMYAQLQAKGKTEETAKVENLNASVQSIAKELSKGEDGKENIDLANQIIEAAKMFNLEGLTEAQLKERVAMAAKHVPDYKPPKEQTNKGGGKPVKQTKDADDPFGVDQIVEDVRKGSDGNYSL